MLQVVDLGVLSLLALDKGDRVVEILLLEMVFVILPQDFDLAAEVVVRALDQLELAKFSMPIKVLALNLVATLVVALDHLAQAAVVVGLEVLVDNDGRAAQILALNASVAAGDLVGVQFPPLELDDAALLKQGLSLIRALDDLKGADVADMVLHLAPRDAGAAVVLALDFELLAVLPDVLIHVVEWEHESALEEAVDDPEGTLVKLMLI